MVQTALTIAGSDSGGGAGIQADLRTFAFHRVHGASAVTCITAQNTVSVTQVVPLASEAVVAQITAVASDIGIQAVKTGMLLNEDIIAAVTEQVRYWQLPGLVVDPVMVSRAGDQLIDDAAIAHLQEKLLPAALIVTPNRYEAQLLAGMTINTLEDMHTAAVAIYRQGAAAVLVKGGAMPGELRGVDVWFDGRAETLSTEVVDTANTHGTGCTLSAAIAANIALGHSPLAAVRQAKGYITSALKHSLDIGQGSGPVGHFFPILTSESRDTHS